MANEQLIEKITEFQNKQRSIKIWIGSLGGIYLLFVFFTFANMLDKVSATIFYIEILLGLLVFVSFFLLNKLSFPMAKRKFAKRPEFTDLVSKLEPNDVDEKPEKVASRISGK